MNSDYSDDVTNSNSGNRALDALAAIRARARPTQENSPSLGDLREETSQVGPEAASAEDIASAGTAHPIEGDADESVGAVVLHPPLTGCRPSDPHAEAPQWTWAS